MNQVGRSNEPWMLLVKCGSVGRSLLLIIAGLLVSGMGSVDAQTPRFEIEVNDTPTPDDDYFCWTPTPARVRMVGGETPVTVIVGGRGQSSGAVVFQAHNGARPTSADFSPRASVELKLVATGDWTPFWVAGSRASTNGKDTDIVVTRADGVEVAAVRVMVRVRKDAATLDADEIRRFLAALRTHHDLDNGGSASKYIKYADAHERAFRVGIHHGGSPRFWPLFLAWHRAFLLSIERELQSIDRSVALPYWRFDRDDAPKGGSRGIFTPDFMGTVSGAADKPGGFVVHFSNDNPLYGWSHPSDGALVRHRDGISALIPAGRLDSLFMQRSTAGNLINNTYIRVNGSLELRYHNGAHSRIGGWLNRADSPTDPLFYLLHANVDRAWALWQQRDPAVRFDPSRGEAYHAQGRYAGSSRDRYRKGSYSEDLMWPWAGMPGNQGNEDPMDDWPEISFELPFGRGVGGSLNRPTPGSMIDYLDRRGRSAGIGACYDHIGFQ